MKKKVGDLTREEIQKIHNKHAIKGGCEINCPLLNANGINHFCMVSKPYLRKKYQNKEVEVEE